MAAADAQEAERGAARQSDATEAVAATMEEMSVSITAVADGADQVRGEAERMQLAFAEIQAFVEDFLRRATVISDLTHQVKDVAGQTNLLALNAAIEAARAAARLERWLRAWSCRSRIYAFRSAD